MSTWKAGSSSVSSITLTPHPPKSWPANVVYLTEPAYSQLAQNEPLAKVAAPPDVSVQAIPSNVVSTAHSKVRIKPIEEPTHPAYGQHGLFATHHLPPDSFIQLYLGLVHVSSEADANSSYDLSLDREFGIAIDATKMGNEARFINDYRGIGREGPSAEFRDCWIDTGGGKVERRMGVFVLGAGKSGNRAKGIAKGEEILVSYGKGFWSARNSPEAAEAAENACNGSLYENLDITSPD